MSASWASWHALTVMAWGLGMVLLPASQSAEGQVLAGTLGVVALASLGASLLVLAGTRGRQ